MRIVAPAKLNLQLRITGKRADGYHTLQSLVAFTTFGDELFIEAADTLTLEIYGEFATLISAEDNLILKAARALSTHHGAKISLVKNIPVGAGLGGGSADAAAALNALNKLWGLHYTAEKLQQIAASLGSDIGACLTSTTQWMEGTGNQLNTMLFQPVWHVLLVYPHIPLSAAEVYRRVLPPYTTPKTIPDFPTPSGWLNYLQQESNELATPACTILPALVPLTQAMQQLPNSLLARMSGSGSACFALFENEESAQQAEQLIKKQFPDYWSTTTRFNACGL